MSAKNIKEIILMLFFFTFIFGTYFLFPPKYSADSLRYAYAGYQLLSSFFYDISIPLFGEKYENEINFHSNKDYSFPKREFFTIIPNLIFYYLSIIKTDGLKFLILINLLTYSLLAYMCLKIFNKEKNNIKYLLILFLFFGHYQLAGWSVKILPEVIYFFFLILFLKNFMHLDGYKLRDFFILIFLSIICFLIRPQGIIFVFFTLIIFSFNFIFEKINYIMLSILFILAIFFIPLFLYFDVNQIVDVPIINSKNTSIHDGAIISGWLNYYNEQLIYQETRFDDKNFNFEQNFSYLDILKITSLRLISFINPYKFYYSSIINLWNIFYFCILYFLSFYFILKEKNYCKKNQILLLIIMILSFHMLFPVTGTIRYQLSLIAVLFILILNNLKFLIKNEK